MPNIEQDLDALLGGGQAPTAGGNIDQDLDALLGGQQPEQASGAPRGSFGQILPQLGESGKSPLSPMQEIGFSTAGNDKDLQFKALQKFLPDSEITVDADGDFMIDGARLNPKGFDMGDITRNLTDAIPLLAQVGGSIAGGTAGSAVGPVGTVGGMIAGGVGGATAGRTAQLALSNLFGLDADGKDYLEAISDEARIALTGEVLGAGLMGAGALTGKALKPVGKALSNTKMAKGASNMWTNILKKLKNKAPNVIEYISGVKTPVTRYTVDPLINGGQSISEVLAPKFFDEKFGGKLSAKLIFNSNIDDIIGDFSLANRKVTPALRKFIQNTVDNKSFVGNRELVKLLSKGQIDDATIDYIIKRGSADRILNKANLDPDAPLTLAKKFVDLLSGERGTLGKQIEKARNAAIKQRGARSQMPVGDTLDALAKIVDDATKPLVSEGKRGPVGPLREINNILKRMTAEGAQPVRVTTLKNALELDKVLDRTADVFVKSKTISGKTVGEFLDIKKAFSSQIDDVLGVKEANSFFHEFVDILDKSKFSKKINVEGLENRFATFSQQSRFFQNSVDNVVKASKGNKNLKFLSDLDDYNFSKKLVDFDKAGGLSSMLNDMTKIANGSQNFLAGTGDNMIESQLRQMSKKSKIDFFKEILNREAALGYSGSNPNVLRISSILGMAGLGGFALGGPVGGAAAIGVASALTPSGIGKGLVKFDKAVNIKKHLIDTASKGLKKVANEKNLAMSRAILGRLVAGNNQSQ